MPLSELQRDFLISQVYVFGHLPIVAGLTAVGAGTRLAIEHAHEAALSAGTAWALCGGAALYRISTSVVRVLVMARSPDDAIGASRLLAAIPVVVLALLHALLAPLLLVGLLLAVLAVQVLLELAVIGPKTNLV